MTDDEGFIRAIVDAPGDDAPRLVYADWLDERGDPRAAFVRQEVDVFRGPRDGPAFRGGVRDLQLARRGFEPVWVARVSRPPVGVCSDVIRFDTDNLPPGPPVVPEDLQAFEDRHAVTLPAAYRAFLLNQNGGYPYPGEFARPNADPDDLSVSLDSFAAIAPRAGMPADYPGASPMYGVYSEPALGIDLYVVIAADGSDGVVFLATVGPDAGQVIYHDDWTHESYDADRYAVVAPSLPAFLAALFTSDPEWAQHIVRNDAARLRAWLDGGGDPNAVHPENEYTPLMYAIDWHRTDMLRELLARGARVTRGLRQLSGYHGSREVAALIDAALRRGR